tara:strand:- start:6 stop:137 length:132 start_codon:yes stop_codon:yes gene_type:complete
VGFDVLLQNLFEFGSLKEVVLLSGSTNIIDHHLSDASWAIVLE